MKKCSGCKEQKPLTEFQKDVQQNDGLRRYCRTCRTARYKTYVARWRESPVPVPEMKLCNGCKVVLPITAFSKDSHTPTGISFYCRACKGKTRAISRQRLMADPARRARHQLIERLRPHGLTIKAYQEMMMAQNGTCAICPAPATDIDHCHTTGRIRGLLCNPCNQGIGLLKDNSAQLRAAAAYLDRP